MSGETNWQVGCGRNGLERQNNYNDIIQRAYELYPSVEPKMLKSLLYQESNLNEKVGINAFGYAGIAQIGKEAAQDLGIRYPEDCHLPHVAIVSAAKYLDRIKGYFEQFGMAGNPDMLKFLCAGYNGGMGLILRTALNSSRPTEVTWIECIQPIEMPRQSILWKSIEGILPTWLPHKYYEISEYPEQIFWRAYQDEGQGLVAIQRELANQGLYSGAIDGVYGPKTKAAIEAYQKNNNLPITGYPDFRL